MWDELPEESEPDGDSVPMDLNFRLADAAANKVLAMVSWRGSILPPLMDLEFDWLHGVTMELLEPLDERSNWNPVGKLERSIEMLVRQIGVSISSEDLRIRHRDLFARVTSDPAFPRTVSDEQIYNALTREKVIMNNERMKDVLLAFGADPGRIQSVLIKMESIIKNFILVKKFSSYSSADGILAPLDISPTNLERITVIPDVVIGQLRDVLLQVGFLCCVMNQDPETGLLRRVRLRVSGWHLNKIVNVLGSYPQVTNFENIIY
jgi:hypothetical protein